MNEATKSPSVDLDALEQTLAGKSHEAFAPPRLRTMPKPPLRATDDILAERGKVHGVFEDHAGFTQQMKRILNQSPRYQGPGFTDSQREALEMIAHKMGRILAGDPNHVDHWSDIAGYARLVERELTK